MGQTHFPRTIIIKNKYVIKDEEFIKLRDLLLQTRKIVSLF